MVENVLEVVRNREEGAGVKLRLRKSMVRMSECERFIETTKMTSLRISTCETTQAYFPAVKASSHCFFSSCSHSADPRTNMRLAANAAHECPNVRNRE